MEVEKSEKTTDKKYKKLKGRIRQLEENQIAFQKSTGSAFGWVALLMGTLIITLIYLVIRPYIYSN